MGDAGSLFLGFVISSSTVLIFSGGYFPNASVAAVAAALLLMGFVPVVDTCTVMISRQRAGQRWNHGGTDHISHRLRAVGLGTSHAALLLSLTAAITTALGSLVVGGIVPAQELLGATVPIGVMVVTLALKVEVRRSRAAEQPSASRTPEPSREGALRLGASPNGLVPGQRLARDSAMSYGEESPGRDDRGLWVRLPR
jgi:UDP-GlcNAc:undecaprenyl-phosphate GlcNAc-1-phosphate transferase